MTAPEEPGPQWTAKAMTVLLAVGVAGLVVMCGIVGWVVVQLQR